MVQRAAVPSVLFHSRCGDVVAADGKGFRCPPGVGAVLVVVIVAFPNSIVPQGNAAIGFVPQQMGDVCGVHSHSANSVSRVRAIYGLVGSGNDGTGGVIVDLPERGGAIGVEQRPEGIIAVGGEADHLRGRLRLRLRGGKGEKQRARQNKKRREASELNHDDNHLLSAVHRQRRTQTAPYTDSRDRPLGIVTSRLHHSRQMACCQGWDAE